MTTENVSGSSGVVPSQGTTASCCRGGAPTRKGLPKELMSHHRSSCVGRGIVEEGVGEVTTSRLKPVGECDLAIGGRSLPPRRRRSTGVGGVDQRADVMSSTKLRLLRRH
jgi:hypothetical protein